MAAYINKKGLKELFKIDFGHNKVIIDIYILLNLNKVEWINYVVKLIV